MSTTCRQQAFINAPLDTVWELASDPDRQTEWWPDTITFECIDGEFEQGCHVRNVQKRPWPMSDLETTLEVDRMVPGKELTIRCMDLRDVHPGCPHGGSGRNLPREWRRATIRSIDAAMQFAVAASGSSVTGSRQHWSGLRTSGGERSGDGSWVILDSNQGPRPYQRRALTN